MQKLISSLVLDISDLLLFLQFLDKILLKSSFVQESTLLIVVKKFYVGQHQTKTFKFTCKQDFVAPFYIQFYQVCINFVCQIMTSLNYLPQPRAQVCPTQPRIFLQRYSSLVNPATSSYYNRQYGNKVHAVLATGKVNDFPITHDFQSDDNKSNTNSFVHKMADLDVYKTDKNHYQYPYQPNVNKIQGETHKQIVKVTPQLKLNQKQHIQMSTTQYSKNSDGNSKLSHSPRIINPHPKTKSYQQIQHQRQLKSMWNRINDCKSVQQRKKDNSDPFAHPIYFVRSPQLGKNLNMERHYQKIANRHKSNNKKKRSSSYRITHLYQNPESNINSHKIYASKDRKIVEQTRETTNQLNQMLSNKYRQLSSRMQKLQNQLPQPTFLKPQINKGKKDEKITENKELQMSIKQELQKSQAIITKVNAFKVKKNSISTANKNLSMVSHPLNLPELEQTAIIKHIIEHNIYKPEDLKIIYSRFCHNYGSKQTDKVWNKIMKWFEGTQNKKRVKKKRD